MNVKHRKKPAILIFFQSLSNLSENWSLVACITHFGRIQNIVSCYRATQGQIIRVICEKSQSFFFSHYWICRELAISYMYTGNKFGKDSWKTFHVIALTMSNYWRKMRKSTIHLPLRFFQLLSKLSGNWSFVTCITNLERKHKKLFKLSRR